MSDEVKALLRAGEEARWQRRPFAAMDAYRRALEVARSSPVDEDLIPALAGVAQIERDLGRPEAAVPLYEEAAAVCRSLDRPLLLAHTIRHLGEVHHEAGRLVPAEDCLVEALALYRTHEDGRGTLDLANAVRPMAILRASTGPKEEAVSLWEEARALYAEVGVDAGVEEADAWLKRLR